MFNTDFLLFNALLYNNIKRSALKIREVRK
jgi:hypothetical protein